MSYAMSYCIHCSVEYTSPSCPSCTPCQVGVHYGAYRVSQPLSERPDYCLYEVRDLENNLGVMKVLCNGNVKEHIKHLDREQQILQSLTHPGIPSFLGRFTALPDGLHCLVWSYSGGRNVKESLSQGEPISESQARKWLRQLTEILQEVHRCEFEHLDIRPSNIICGSDEQLVLQNFNVSSEVVAVSYVPPEQVRGESVPQSDFFALGKTFIYLLTGQDPGNFTDDEGNWQDSAPQISKPLVALINKLVAPNVEDRPETAQAILDSINHLSDPINPALVETPQTDRKREIVTLAWVVGVLLAGIVGVLLAWVVGVLSNPACDYKIGDEFSCGEESLFENSRNLTPEKISGINAFKNKQYNQAIDKFTQARGKEPADPETLIFLNNARLEAKLQANENARVLTIPVIVPIDGVDPSLPETILRGAAQYQDKFNKGANSLRVIIADDHSRTKNAKHIAERLVEDSEISGVVGHYASEVSQKGLETYLKNNLAMISYGSTAQTLSCSSDNPTCQKIFFRTVPTTEVTALILAKYLNNLSSNNVSHRVAIFNNPDSLFSHNLAESFKRKLGDGKLVLEEDVCQTQFDVETIVNEMEQKKVNIVALFPDGGTCASSRRNVIYLINEKRRRDEKRRSSNRETSILGGWSVLGADTLNDEGFMREAMNHLAMFSPWDPWSVEKSSESKEFLKNANNLWLPKETGKTLRDTEIFENGTISGVTATTYDAIQALVTAIENSWKPSRPTRDQVRATLADPNFTAKGVTGKISFNGSDRRENIGGLVTIIPSCDDLKKKKYYIVPLNPKPPNCSSP
jgi:eukaryotic-like serine/threonine-protein kinase